MLTRSCRAFLSCGHLVPVWTSADGHTGPNSSPLPTALGQLHLTLSLRGSSYVHGIARCNTAGRGQTITSPTFHARDETYGCHVTALGHWSQETWRKEEIVGFARFDRGLGIDLRSLHACDSSWRRCGGGPLESVGFIEATAFLGVSGGGSGGRIPISNGSIGENSCADPMYASRVISRATPPPGIAAEQPAQGQVPKQT